MLACVCPEKAWYYRTRLRSRFKEPSELLRPSMFASSKGPCTQIVYTLALKYLYRDYTEAKVYDIWVHGPSGFRTCQGKLLAPPAGSAASMLLGRHGSLGVFALGISRF